MSKAEENQGGVSGNHQNKDGGTRQQRNLIADFVWCQKKGNIDQEGGRKI